MIKDWPQKPARGRPPKYTDPEEMRKAINIYYRDCERRGVAPTIPGLAGACGFESRDFLFKYSAKSDAFASVINDARRYIEQHRVEQLLNKTSGFSGHIFDLKANFGYRDKTEVEHSNPDGNMGTKVLTVLPKEPKSLEEWMHWYEMTQRKDPDSIDISPSEAAPQGEWQLP